jgi:hypothetical protein
MGGSCDHWREECRANFGLFCLQGRVYRCADDSRTIPPSLPIAETKVPQASKLPQDKKINWLHVSTLIAVAILVGTEMVGASWAAGWALGGLLQLDPMISHVLEVIFALCGFVLLFYFMRTALRNEQVRG